MTNKKVLIISYYWPPAGGSGVQRWLKFVKYLVRAGWEPYVFTPENPSYTIQDHSLLKDIPKSVEVVKFPIWEPYQLFFKIASLFGSKNLQQTDFVSTDKKSFIKRVSSWIRGNFFIPDARVFWIKPSANYLHDFVIRNQIDKIITTGPPHSVHLIGLRLKNRNPALRWIADFRDPWSEWDLLDTFSLTAIARKIHASQERKVLQRSDVVLTVTPFYKERFKALGARDVVLITNGFDEDDFVNIAHSRTTKFTVRHIGGMDELRDPRSIMRAIKELYLENEDFSGDIVIEFVGSVNSSFRLFVESDSILKQIVKFRNHIPHTELLNVYGNTDVLLLVLAHQSIAVGNLPGKLFEYLASGKPILGVGAVDGDAAEILQQTKAGVIKDRNDVEGIKLQVRQYYEGWKAGDVYENNSIHMYSRKHLTDKLIFVLEQL
jgi:glycosyltransferase involved in cell wall biosynthesis